MPTDLDSNKLRVLNEFRLLQRASKADVARRVGLTHPAVGVIVKRLCEAGYLKEEKKKRQGQRGQPAKLYSLSDDNIFVGIHVGRRRTEFVGLDLSGSVHTSVHLDIGFLQRNELEVQSTPALARFLSRSAIKSRSVVGIGISTPDFWGGWRSVLRIEDGVDTDWSSDAVTRLFRFPPDPPVLVANDGSSAALAELSFGSGASYEDFLYVHIGTFIGGGLVIDGTLRAGAHGNMAALGPFPVAPSILDGSPRPSRPFDDLLGRASIHALREHAARSGATIDVDTWIEAGTPTSIGFLNEWVDDCSGALAQFFVGVWSLIDIESIIVDSTLPRDLLQRIIDATNTWLNDYQVEGIVPSTVKLGKLGPMAQSIGAACLPILQLLGPPPRASHVNETSVGKLPPEPQR